MHQLTAVHTAAVVIQLLAMTVHRMHRLMSTAVVVALLLLLVAIVVQHQPLALAKAIPAPVAAP